MCFNYFVAFWLAAGVLKMVFEKGFFKSRFEALPEDKKCNTVIYVVQLVTTSFALAAQIYGGRDVLFRGQDTTTSVRLDWLVFSIQLVVVLYLWELIYRVSIGWPLLVHHLVTILLCQLVAASIFDTNDPVYLRFALLFGFYATTEQLSFVALLLYRLELCRNWQATVFFAAAAQSFLLKTILSIVSIAYYSTVLHKDLMLDSECNSWCLFWKISFPFLLLALYGAQLFACKILHTLGMRCRRDNIRDRRETPTAQQDSARSEDDVSIIWHNATSEQDEEAALATEAALFQQVATMIRGSYKQPLRQANTEEKLRMYGLYKRGTVGRLHPPFEEEDMTADGQRPASRPSRFPVEGRLKYDAWERADALTKQEAQRAYLDLAGELFGQSATDAIAKCSSTKDASRGDAQESAPSVGICLAL
jgi:acyl-CoA-binding protein